MAVGRLASCTLFVGITALGCTPEPTAKIGNCNVALPIDSIMGQAGTISADLVAKAFSKTYSSSCFFGLFGASGVGEGFSMGSVSEDPTSGLFFTLGFSNQPPCTIAVGQSLPLLNNPCVSFAIGPESLPLGISESPATPAFVTLLAYPNRPGEALSIEFPAATTLQVIFETGGSGTLTVFGSAGIVTTADN